jgi:DNA-binding transcriptional LysR family regulator
VDRFDAMTVFARVVEAGSLSAAAGSIPMSLTSVSRLRDIRWWTSIFR